MNANFFGKLNNFLSYLVALNARENGSQKNCEECFISREDLQYLLILEAYLQWG